MKTPLMHPASTWWFSWDLLTEDAYLSIECKRLAPDDLARLYVVCGIDRFVRGYYGAKAQSGAMVGYVVSGAPNAVLARMNGQVARAPSMGLIRLDRSAPFLHRIARDLHRSRRFVSPISR